MYQFAAFWRVSFLKVFLEVIHGGVIGEATLFRVRSSPPSNIRGYGPDRYSFSKI